MTRRMAFLAGVLAALALPVPAAVDGALLALVPAEATMLAGADVRLAKSSPFGQFVLSRMQPEDGDLQKLIQATGFDPRLDLDQVLVAGFAAASSGAKNQGLLLARGRFDIAKITAHAQLIGAAVSNEGGTPVIELGKSDSGLIAFPDATLAIAGDVASVRAALARRAMSGPANAALANLAARWSSNDAWFATTAVSQFSGRLGAGNQKLQSSALQSVETVSGGVRLGADVALKVEAQTRTAGDATALADVLRFLAGMVQLNRERDPQAAQIAAILDKAQITAGGQVVTVELSVPEADLERWINESRKAPGRKPATRRKEASL